MIVCYNIKIVVNLILGGGHLGRNLKKTIKMKNTKWGN